MVDGANQDEQLKYRRLTADIRSWLDSGMFEPGEPVPSIADLAADRECSRQTCARALQALVTEGRLKRYPGSGYHVTGPDAGPRLSDFWDHL